MDLIKWQNRVCSLLMLLAFLGPTKHPEYQKKRFQSNKINPCCDFPCQNGGLCFEINNGYYCDCVNTGYYGKNCTYRFWSLYLKNSFNDFLDFILFNPLNFLIFNSIELLHTLFHSLYIENLIDKVESNYFPSSGNPYLSLTNAYNACLGTQLLPPLPTCPVGKGTKKPPPVDEVFKRLFERKEFVKNPNINLLFVIFGQNLALQFKHCNYVTWMTCSQLYKENERSFKHGKLKVHHRQGEDYPRILKEKLGWIARGERAKSNYLMSQNTMTYLISTIWLREHNRVCNLLVSLWPDWDDERLFETARNIVTGQMLSITYTEWIKKLSYFPIDLRYKPLRKSYILANSVPIEIFMAFHWPQMLPEQMETSTNMSSFILALDPTQVFKQGLYKMFSSLAKTQAGQPGPQNVGKAMAGVAKMLINEGRYYKLPMFNQYRTYLRLDKYKSFSELIGNFKLNDELKKLYGNIENLEFVTGLLLESGDTGRLLGQTSDRLITDWLIKTIMTHPLSSNAFWKSTTLGGKIGFEIIKKTTLKDLICRNVAEKELCNTENLISFDYKKIEKRNSRNFLNRLFNRGL